MSHLREFFLLDAEAQLTHRTVSSRVPTQWLAPQKLSHVEISLNAVLWGHFYLSFFFGRVMNLVGSQFSDQGLNPGHVSESLES